MSQISLREKIRRIVEIVRPRHQDVRKLADVVADNLDATVKLPEPFETLDGIVLRVVIRWLFHEAIIALTGRKPFRAFRLFNRAEVPPYVDALAQLDPPLELVDRRAA